ncbi:thiopeptide-type bacteriocin biosynthesis protein [Actinoplanes sp. NPDC023801]|uniref:thiopeptide-type bacteriocin biosynthesis protein n=1 Tax=Actinoplanes sp. NPDC023801 TaxID=3154595 RepID=UPI0033C8B110
MTARPVEVVVGDRRWDLPGFLDLCGSALGLCATEAGDLHRLREALTGVPLPAPVETDRWVQFDVAVTGAGPRLYAGLAAAVTGLRDSGLLGDFFLMHKSPGLRLRCRATGDTAALCRRIGDSLAWLRDDGLIGDHHPWRYEPEQRLFGGPVSMRHVHRLFTADTAAWLDVHAAGPHSPATVWAMSLLMIRALLDALGVTGWEDLDVWDRIERHGGRVLAPAAATDPRAVRLISALRRGWADPDSLGGRLPAPARAALDTWRAAVPAIAADWISEYFATGAATVGPRAAAAFTVIFHWNRARLPLGQQALITHALAARTPGVAS